uniref:Beta-lactamase domain-containing protein n=1 Tax=Caenorhabditis tropicalis TaxID=1561998 RepID=A0A1I7T780_9PELO
MPDLQDHLNMLLAMNSSIEKAAIISVNGGLLAKTRGEHFFLDDREELKRFAEIFAHPELLDNGVILERILYGDVGLHNNILYGYLGGAGFFAVKSASKIVIAVYQGNEFQAHRTRAMVCDLSFALGRENLARAR